jgi:class 3 adenylate cyclase
MRSSRLPHFQVAEDRGGPATLDWRHYIFDAEHGVLKTSRDILRQMQSKSRIHVHSAGQGDAKSSSSSARATSFIPQVIVHAIHEGRVKITDTEKVVLESPINSTYDPIVQSLDAVVVFMDASGFTSLTERLARQANGAEEIGRCLNSFFGPLIDIICSFGGDVLKFSGDAITVLWPIVPEGWSKEDSEMYRTWSRSRDSAAEKACLCCMDVQAQVGSFGRTPIEDLNLTLHIGVGLGHLHILQLGGLMNRWEYCAAGPPLEEVAVAEPLASPGQTVVSPSVVAALQKSQGYSKFQFFKVKDHSAPEGFRRLELRRDRRSDQSLSLGGSSPLTEFLEEHLPGIFKRTFIPASRGTGVVPEAPKEEPRNSGTISRDINTTRLASGDDLSPKVMSPVQASLAERYVPRAVLRNLSDGELNPEMRRVSIVFFQLSGTDPGRYQEDAIRTQLVVRLLQRSCYALEGSVNKFLVDDKGMVLLACFGLPPLNHFTDDPLRAVLAATRFCDTLREENLVGRAGIATGMCWCGVVGNETRREYTVLGDVVNLSARLMGRAGQNCVLVDEATQSACGSILEIKSLGEITVKGKEDPVPVYEFAGRTIARLKGKQPNPALLGWDKWPAKIALDSAFAEQFQEAGSASSAVVFVKGGPGSGKTEIAAHIRHWAQEQGLALLSGQNMNVTSTIAVQLLCWQEVFKQLMIVAASDPYWTKRLGEVGVAPSELSSSSTYLYQLLIVMLKQAGASEDLLAWAPLMNAVLTGLDFGPKVVQAMLERDEQHTRERSRLGELCELLVDAFTSYSSVHRGTLVLVHFKRSTSFFQSLDQHSAHIARALVRLTKRRNKEGRPHPVFLCVVSRAGLLSDEALVQGAIDCKGLVDVTDLSLWETEQYIQQILCNDQLDGDLINYVFTTSGGNPFAIHELCQKLKQECVLVRKAGSYELAEDWPLNRLHCEFPYPEKLVGVALAEFEKLAPAEQHLLKIAAIFCQETSEVAISSFCALDLAESLRKNQTPTNGESNGVAVRAEVVSKVEEHCFRLQSADIFVDANHHRRSTTSRSDSGASLSEDVDSPVLDSPQTPLDVTTGSYGGVLSWNSRLGEPETRRYFRFKSQLLRHVASTLVLQAQKEEILVGMTKSARTSRRLLTTRSGQQTILSVPSASTLHSMTPSGSSLRHNHSVTSVTSHVIHALTPRDSRAAR